VDLSYAGEVHISVVNTSDDIIELLPNEKIIQFILTPIICCDIIEVKYEDLYKEFAHTSRNQGGFGSSGK
jgi:dUTPase